MRFINTVYFLPNTKRLGTVGPSPLFRLMLEESSLESLIGLESCSWPCKENKLKAFPRKEESNCGASHSVLNEQVMMRDRFVPWINSLLLAHNHAEWLIVYKYNSRAFDLIAWQYKQ